MVCSISTSIKRFDWPNYGDGRILAAETGSKSDCVRVPEQDAAVQGSEGGDILRGQRKIKDIYI